MKYLFNKSMIFLMTMLTSISLAHGFEIKFDSSGTNTVTDFKAAQNAVLSSSITFSPSTTEKVLTYTIPEELSVVDVADETATVTENNGVTTVAVTYPASQNGALTTSITLGLDASKMHSLASYSVTVAFDDGNGGSPETKTANISVYNYAGQSTNYVKFYRMLTEIDPLFNDQELTYRFQPANSGDYSGNGSLSDGGYKTYLKDVTIDLSKLLVDTSGTGNNYVAADTTAIDVTLDNKVTGYDSDSGIITIADGTNFASVGLIPVTLKFDSSKYPAHSLLKFNIEDLLSYTACENDSDCTGTEPEGKIRVDYTHDPYELEILGGGHYFNVSLLRTASKNRVMTDTDNQPLFEIVGENYLEELENVKFDIDIPAGITIQQIFPGTGLYKTVTISDGTNSQTFTANGGNYIEDAINLDYPIDGDITDKITITLAGSYAVNGSDGDKDNPYFPDRFIKVLGKVDSAIYPEGDQFEVEVDTNSITADIIDYPTVGNTTTGEIVEDPDDDFDLLGRTVQYLQTPAPHISNEYQDSTGATVTNINYDPSQETAIDMVSNIEIYDYAYGSDYHQLDNPVIYFSIPEQLIPASGASDFSRDDVELIDSELGDLSGSITSVTPVAGNATFANGQIIEIKMDGYSLVYPNILTARIKTIVAPSVLETVTLSEASPYSIAVGTLDNTTTDNLQAINNNTISATDLVDSSDAVNNTLVTNSLDDLSLVIPSEVSAQLMVNTDIDSSDEDDDYEIIEPTTDPASYPGYYLVANGAYKVIFRNFTAVTASDFYGTVTLPDVAVDQILEPSVASGNSSSSLNPDVAYSTDGGVTYGAFPSDGKGVTNIQYHFQSFDPASLYQATVQFTTDALTTEDDSIYGGDAADDGDIEYKYIGTSSNNGTTTGIQIVKSKPPVIILNSISDSDEYDYDDIADLALDIADYEVSDDRTASVTDIVKDDNTLVAFTKDSESTGSLSAPTLSFAELQSAAGSYSDSAYDSGKFAITYQSDKDYDAQQTEELINITIYPKPYLTDPTTDPVSVEYGASMTLDDLITQSGIVDKGNDSSHYNLDKTSPDTINTKDTSKLPVPVTVDLDDTGHGNDAIDSKVANYIVALPVLTLSNTTVYVTQGDIMTDSELSDAIGITVTGDASGDVVASVTDSTNVDFSTPGCYQVTVTMTDSVTMEVLDTQEAEVCVEAFVGVTPTPTSATPVPGTSLYSLLMLVLLLSGVTYYRKK